MDWFDDRKVFPPPPMSTDGEAAVSSPSVLFDPTIPPDIGYGDPRAAGYIIKHMPDRHLTDTIGIKRNRMRVRKMSATTAT